jgi:hypothetical protein
MAKIRHRDRAAASAEIARLAVVALTEGDTREAASLLGFIVGLGEVVPPGDPDIVNAIVSRAARRITIHRFIEILQAKGVLSS